MNWLNVLDILSDVFVILYIPIIVWLLMTPLKRFDKVTSFLRNKFLGLPKVDSDSAKENKTKNKEIFLLGQFILVLTGLLNIDFSIMYFIRGNFAAGFAYIVVTFWIVILGVDHASQRWLQKWQDQLIDLQHEQIISIRKMHDLAWEQVKSWKSMTERLLEAAGLQIVNGKVIKIEKAKRKPGRPRKIRN